MLWLFAQWKSQGIASATIANVVSQPTVGLMGSMTSSNANTSSSSKMNEIASMVVAELKTQDAASAATARIKSLPAASKVGITASSESGIVEKLSSTSTCGVFLALVSSPPGCIEVDNNFLK